MTLLLLLALSRNTEQSDLDATQNIQCSLPFLTDTQTYHIHKVKQENYLHNQGMLSANNFLSSYHFLRQSILGHGHPFFPGLAQHPEVHSDPNLRFGARGGNSPLKSFSLYIQ